jgi:hypothetical protein
MAEHRKNVLAELRVDASQNVVFAKARRKLVTVTRTGLVSTAKRIMKMKPRNQISILLILVFMPIICGEAHNGI